MADIREELVAIVGEKYVITPERPEYWSYTFGDATMYRSKPDIVVYPRNTEEIQLVIKVAGKHGVPVVTAAGLTGLSGGAVATSGILLNVNRLRSVIDIDPISRTVVTQPGISCLALNQKLAVFGMVLPVAPASHAQSTIGANIAESSGGTWGMSKGTFKNYLLALKVVDGAGKLFTTGYRCAKASVGPDLTSLMIGSEGIFGVITELTFRLDFIPETIWTIRCSFADESVLQSIHEAVAQERINLYSFEYMDEKMMGCFGKKNMLLLFQTAGSKHGAKETADRVIAVLNKLNPIELKYTNDPKEADVLYAERNACLGALAKADKKKPIIVQFDPVLPLSKSPRARARCANSPRKTALILLSTGMPATATCIPVSLSLPISK
jgi:glycolate oxidase